MKFSQKIGKTPVRSILQVDEIDVDLQNRLWNTILRDFFEKFSSTIPLNEDSARGQIFLMIWRQFLNKPVDEIPVYRDYKKDVYLDGFIKYFKKWFFDASWYELYDLLEYLSKLDKIFKVGFTSNCNMALQQELSGYRLINESVVRITSEEEIQEIEEALDSKNEFKTINTHLKTALAFLSDRKHPDYRNSIKESISAVEALCIIITNDKEATLGKALTIIEKTHSLHKSLKTAFTAIYGYTSDSSGIRHALTSENVSIGFEDAKFMLVSCSAFINYLKNKMKI